MEARLIRVVTRSETIDIDILIKSSNDDRKIRNIRITSNLLMRERRGNHFC